MSEEVKPYPADGDGLFGKAGEQVIAPLEKASRDACLFLFQSGMGHGPQARTGFARVEVNGGRQRCRPVSSAVFSRAGLGSEVMGHGPQAGTGFALVETGRGRLAPTLH